MKRNKLNILTLVITLLLFFFLSMTPCIQYESGPVSSGITGEVDEISRQASVRFSSYMPQIVGIVVLIQLVMLALRPRVFTRALGLIMTLLAMVVPFPLFVWLNRFMADAFSKANIPANHRLTSAGLLLWALGAAIILIYISEIRSIRKQLARAAMPAQTQQAYTEYNPYIQ